MSYPQIENALNWLKDYLDPNVTPTTPLAQLQIANVWNDGLTQYGSPNAYGVIRRPSEALEPEEVRVSYYSGRTYQGVIYVSEGIFDQEPGSVQRKRRWEVTVPIYVKLFARYDGSPTNHQALVQAFNETIIKEDVDLESLGGNANAAFTQPSGGSLPNLDSRYQIAETILLTRFQFNLT